MKNGITTYESMLQWAKRIVALDQQVSECQAEFAKLVGKGDGPMTMVREDAAPVRRRSRRAGPGEMRATVEAFVASQKGDPFTVAVAARKMGARRQAAHAALHRLTKEGKIRRISRGLYQAAA